MVEHRVIFEKRTRAWYFIGKLLQKLCLTVRLERVVLTVRNDRMLCSSGDLRSGIALVLSEKS